MTKSVSACPDAILLTRSDRLPNSLVLLQFNIMGTEHALYEVRHCLPVPLIPSLMSSFQAVSMMLRMIQVG